MLCMPVKLEGSGLERRMLEVRMRVCGVVRSSLAFRDDADRQGESGDVVSWPPISDPRTKELLPGLLSSLAARTRQYHPVECNGFTSSWRRAVQFLRRRHYPVRWWMRPFALAAVRHGAKIGLLPRCLRLALSTNPVRGVNSLKSEISRDRSCTEQQCILHGFPSVRRFSLSPFFLSFLFPFMYLLQLTLLPPTETVYILLYRLL